MAKGHRTRTNKIQHENDDRVGSMKDQIKAFQRSWIKPKYSMNVKNMVAAD